MGAVDRVDVPAGRGVAGLGSVLLADEAVIRICGEDPLPDHPLDRGVGLGDEGPVGLRRDVEVAPERRPGERIGFIAQGVGEDEPRVELRLRRAPERRAPLGSEPGALVHHERIRSLPGSYSGSRITSKPIHSPKTSISPRVPSGASGGR